MAKKNWKFEILHNTGSDIIRWNTLLEPISNKDIYFTPDYMKLFENKSEVSQDFGGEPLLAFYGNDNEYILYPFFKRPINDLIFYKSMSLNYGLIYDIISPWYFSGILFYTSNIKTANPVLINNILHDFFINFHEYCIKQNIISEFMRFHPFINNHILLSGEFENVKKSQEVVYIDLSLDKDTIINNFKKSNRNCITKSRRSHVNVYQSRNITDIDSFFQLYTRTMECVNANNRYFFPKSFLYNIFDSLGESATLFIAEYETKPIAASLFLNNCGFVHYYLSGSDSDYGKLCPTNLLLHEAIMWAKDAGYKLFELGGGYKKDDSLYNFKSSFSKTTADFYTYRKIHNTEIYASLCAYRDEYYKIKGFTPNLESDYFPAYRSK